MNKLKISAYALIIVSVLNVGILYPVRQLSNTMTAMNIRYAGLKEKADSIYAFQDSLIYHPDFRTKVLGPKITRAKLDSALAKNRTTVKSVIKKAEELFEARKRLERNFMIIQTVERLLNLLTLITGGFMAYYWINMKKSAES